MTTGGKYLTNIRIIVDMMLMVLEESEMPEYFTCVYVRLQKVCFFCIRRFTAIIGCWLFLQGIAFASIGLNTEYPDVFAHEDIHVRANQIIGRLLVAKSNAMVEGVVTEGIIVVDGNLLITSTAEIKGTVIVLGGHVEQEEGAQLKKQIWYVAPHGFPMADIVVVGFVILGASSLVILPILVWLAVCLVHNTLLYNLIREVFLRLQQRYPALFIAAALGVSGLMLLLFSKMAWETLFRKTMDVFDSGFIWLIRYYASPTVDRVMIFITNLGFGYIYGYIVTLSFLIIGFYRRWLEMTGLAICLAGGAILNVMLKHLFERARPDLLRVVEETGYSFPSGHAMVSFCFYGMLALMVANNINSIHRRIAVTSFAIMLVVAIGVSRIYLGVHYPTDVVAGYTAGAMWLSFCISLLTWWKQRQAKKQKLIDN